MIVQPLYNEKELLSLVSLGDELAFTTLFNHYYNRIYSIAYKLSGTSLIAEEIVQDVFLTIWLKRVDLNQIQNFGAYLYKIVQNKVYKVLLHTAQQYRNERQPLPEYSQRLNDPESHLIEKQYQVILHQGIEKLPTQQKQVYKLIREKGMKRTEVANLLNLQPETVKFHLSKAVKNLWQYCQLHLHFIVVAVLAALLCCAAAAEI